MAASVLRALLFLLGLILSSYEVLYCMFHMESEDVGGAQVLATGKSAEAEVDIKYAIIGIALGVAILAGFLALKICMIKKHLFDIDSSDLRFNDTISLKKTAPRSILNLSEREARVIEL